MILLFLLVDKFNGFSFLINPKCNGLFLIRPFSIEKDCVYKLYTHYTQSAPTGNGDQSSFLKECFLMVEKSMAFHF